MNHEFNAQIEAEVMLREPCDQWEIVHHGTMGSGPVWMKEKPCEHERCYPVGYPADYFGSMDAAWQMEEEIKRRGLRQNYATELAVIVDACHERRVTYCLGFIAVWLVAHATPEQRCRAALEAVREK